jgi:hypothetical protein
MTCGKKLTIKEIIKRIKKVHGDIVTLDISTYINTQTKCIFIDKDYGPWPAKPSFILLGQGHPKRGREKAAKKAMMTIEKVKKRIKKVYGDKLFLDESTYIDTQTKCRFVDKDFPNDEWWAVPVSIFRGYVHPKRAVLNRKQTCFKHFGAGYPIQNKQIKEKIKETNLKNHGCEYPMQNKEIALKAAKAQNNSGIIKHWKTGEDCIWVGSFEETVLLNNNENKVEYLWQPEVFKMPNGNTYRPDMYLIKEKIYVEIKRI